MRPTSRALTVIVFLLVVAAGVLVVLAAGAQDLANAQPSMIDWNVVEAKARAVADYAAGHPYFTLAVASWLVYFVLGTAAIMSLRVRYKDRAEAPFLVLLAWNVLEITCGNVWRIQRKYWPSLPVRGLDGESGETPNTGGG